MPFTFNDIQIEPYWNVNTVDITTTIADPKFKSNHTGM